MSKTPEKPVMDSAIRERGVGIPAVNNPRACYAIQTLVAEVTALFPEIPYEVSNYDGRNTGLAVTFDLTDMDGGDSVLFNNMLDILDVDERVDDVIAADHDQTFVSMKASARTQDSREPFGLSDAWSIFNDSDDFDSTDPAPDWALSDEEGSA